MLVCVSAGDKLSVKVIEVDPAAGRINFSIKQLQQDPLTQTLDTVGGRQRPGCIFV